jgi:hypothetical protein
VACENTTGVAGASSEVLVTGPEQVARFVARSHGHPCAIRVPCATVPDSLDPISIASDALGSQAFHVHPAPPGSDYYTHVLDANSRRRAAELMLSRLVAEGFAIMKPKGERPMSEELLTELEALRGEISRRPINVELEIEPDGMGRQVATATVLGPDGTVTSMHAPTDSQAFIMTGSPAKTLADYGWSARLEELAAREARIAEIALRVLAIAIKQQERQRAVPDLRAALDGVEATAALDGAMEFADLLRSTVDNAKRDPGASFRAWRHSVGYTIEDCSGLSGYDEAFIDGIEAGAIEPTLDQKVRLSRTLGARVKVLFGPPAQIGTVTIHQCDQCSEEFRSGQQLGAHRRYQHPKEG